MSDYSYLHPKYKICKECECHIQREKCRRDGHTVNLLAYGCEHFNKTGRFCPRDGIVRYCFDVLSCDVQTVSRLEVKDE